MLSVTFSRRVHQDFLYQEAESSFASARSLPYSPQDTFLVNNIPTTTTGTMPWSKKLRAGVVMALVKSTPRERNESRAVHEARAVFAHQHPTTVAQFKARPDIRSVDMLPNGAALADILAVWGTRGHGWQFILPPLARARRGRIPELSDVRAVREITIGEASTHDLEEAALYVQKSLQTQQETFFFALPAADTESVQVTCPDPLGDTVHPMDIARMIKEQRNSGVITLPIGKTGQSATKVPVRFMVGGPGWAMHIRLPVHQTDDYNLVIQRLPFNPATRGLYEAIGVTVGSGITADFHEWFYILHPPDLAGIQGLWADRKTDRVPKTPTGGWCQHHPVKFARCCLVDTGGHTGQVFRCE
jgi:hypothetical protein